MHFVPHDRYRLFDLELILINGKKQLESWIIRDLVCKIILFGYFIEVDIRFICHVVGCLKERVIFHLLCFFP